MHNMRAEQPREQVERIHDSSPIHNRVYREGSPIVMDRPRMVGDGYDRQPSPGSQSISYSSASLS